MSIAASDLTLEEQLGQILMVGFAGTSPTPEIIELIQHHHVGGVVLFSRNVQNVQQLYELTHNLQHLAHESGQLLPLLIAIDQENGRVQRMGADATIFPGNMALGAIGEEQCAYEVARASGSELRALGINLNLAPVVDVNNNPANPVISVRSFGEDPHKVARLATAQIHGYQDAGVATCLKHFPGHGDTAIDSHLAMPAIPYGMERLEQIELVPFKSGIAAGADSVMTAHIYFPALMGATQLPATLSPEVIQHLLREQLGFQGVVMTDCLEMDAIAETIGVARGAVLALRAGNDLLLVSHSYKRQLAALETLKIAFQQGELTPEQVRCAADRVLTLKKRLSQRAGEQTSELSLSCVGCAAHRQLSAQLYERAVTLVKDQEKLLPLRLQPEQRLLVVYTHRDAWTRVEDQRYPEAFLLESVRQRHANIDVTVLTERTTNSDYAELYAHAREADVILMVTVNALLDAQQGEVMRNLLASDRPLIGLAPYSPYDLLAFPELGTYMVTYEYTSPAIAAAVRVLFGEITPRGQLPVSLPV